ncbi:probable G-protein coupled receptor Mth-like 10 [Hetaerina americana]|uniref:probable G-protein coupled receptor Mth-like 10 n=1 Tax=Hetaerina americana TaxID=62018 RepID=UPI003A7F54C6
MASAQFLLILTLVFLHSCSAWLTSTFHYDRVKDKHRLLLTKKREWSPMVASEYQQAMETSTSPIVIDATTPVGEGVVSYEGTSVTDLTRKKKPVLRKCCNFGEELTRTGCLKRESGGPSFLPVVYHNVTHQIEAPLVDLFTLEFGDICLHGRYQIDPSIDAEDEFYLLENGSLWLPVTSTLFSGAETFCMEGFFKDKVSNGDENSVVLPLVCFQPPSKEESDEIAQIMYPVGLLISVPFLMVILIAHILIPRLHSTLNGKCLLGHVSCLIVAYLGLALIQLSRSMLPNHLCQAIAFIVQFAFIACFSWLSAMCFSIWRIISNVSTSFFTAKNTRDSFKSKAFIKHFLFAMSIPVIIITVSMVLDLSPSIPASILKPQFGVGSCWFLTDDAALRYFYGPITILIVGNVFLFVMTARKIVQKSKEEASRSMQRNEQYKKIMTYENRALKVCFSLFVIMGLSWTMEIFSWVAGNQGGIVLKSVWYFTDMYNSLQGLFIFIVFMLDSDFRNLVKQKLSSWGCCKECTDDVDTIDFKKQNQYITMASDLLLE